MCPECRSNELMIKRRSGMEQIMILLTGKRKFICLTCGLVFRAPDRRRYPRESEAALAPQAARKFV